MQSFLKMDSLRKLPATYLNTITLPLNLFKFIGFDFFDDPKTNVKNNCKFILFIICTLTFLTSQIFFIVMIDETGATFLDVANAIPCLFLVFMDVIKLITLMRSKHLVRNIILDVAELWPSESQDESKNKIKIERLRYLKNFAGNILKLTIIGEIVYIWLSMFVFLVNSLEDDDTPYIFPFQLYYPFKIDSLWKYLLIYLIQSVVSSIIHTCVFHASDLLMYTLTFDVCVMLRMLEYDLVNLKVERKGPEAEQSLTTLKHIVKTHQKLLRLIENMNDVFGVIMLAVIVFSSVILCFFGFLAVVARSKYQIFVNVTTLAQVGFIVFYITLPGQILENTSSRFADAAYESSWYDGDPRFRRIICFIIARSQKPCTLRAMGYADMNFGTYSKRYLLFKLWFKLYEPKPKLNGVQLLGKICSSAWSYLSVLNQMYQNVDFEF